MFRKQPFRILPLLLLVSVLVLSGCTSWFQPLKKIGSAPAPVMIEIKGGVDDPNVFVDPAAFQAALLQALTNRDTEKLKMWMTDPFLTGTWRADLSDTSPVDAITSLYADQLGVENRLALVKDADLKTLMGGKDPLSIPRREAAVMDAVLVSGWGKDEHDEAILFIARRTDNSLKWHGWMQVQGGFSGARLGGIKPYKNEIHGFSLYLPKEYEVFTPNDNYVSIVAPQGNGGHPGGAFIFIEPANGRSAEQAADQALETAKAQLGAGSTLSTSTVMGIDGVPAFVINGMPGQDSNRQLFMVHDDLLYRIMFSPDDPQVGDAYRQMEDAYAMIVNTFHFTK